MSYQLRTSNWQKTAQEVIKICHYPESQIVIKRLNSGKNKKKIERILVVKTLNMSTCAFSGHFCFVILFIIDVKPELITSKTCNKTKN